MDHEQITRELAPCGNDCSRCASFADGKIKKLSVELLSELGNFAVLAEKMSSFNPVFRGYGQFTELLEHFTKGNCTGCRNGESGYPSCSARKCHKEQGVDFCFQCSEYPCSRNTYDPALAAKWRANNDEMKASGIPEFYGKQKHAKRY